jgi:hypothetical protein
MKKAEVTIQQLENGVYRVCTPQEGLCVETWDEVRAQSVAEALHCSNHSSIRAWRASVQ